MFYADDTQLCVSCFPGGDERVVSIGNLCLCLEDIRGCGPSYLS